MIVVTPLGHATPFGGGRGGGNARAGSNGGGNGNAPLLSNTILFEQYIFKDVIPTIESCDGVAANADSCAIAGMSMGGERTLAIGFGHPEVFSSIGPLGPSMPRELADRWASVLADPKATNAGWKVLCIKCGRQNPGHLSASRKEHETLEQAGIKHTYSETEGAHNYTLWQQHMVQLTPLLFR